MRDTSVSRGATLVALLVAAAGCRIGFEARTQGDAGADAPDAGPAFAVGGTISGLAGAGLVLTLNDGELLPIASNGPFEFATPVAAGAWYAVAVATQPGGQSCSISRSDGLIANAPVTDVGVTCFTDGQCPATLTFTDDGMFTMPGGCTTLQITATGGGGAGGARHVGDAAAAGGNGGLAIKTLTGVAAGTSFMIKIGRGGRCESVVATAGHHAGGAGGVRKSGDGANGEGTSPPGGAAGAGSPGTSPGGAGGAGGFGGGGGGGGGDKIDGNSGGGSTVIKQLSPVIEVATAGGGGGAGASDQNGDTPGGGGAACNGYNGDPGVDSVAGQRSGGGGGGGGCACAGGCDTVPTPGGGAGGVAGTVFGLGSICEPAQDGANGQLVISFP